MSLALVQRALPALLFAAGSATASAQSLQCSVGSEAAVLGHPFTWTVTGTVTARDLPQPLPAFTPAQFAPDWLLQGQQGASGRDAAGHREASAMLTLYPLRAGALALPAVVADGRQCPAQPVEAADHVSGEAPLQWRTRIDPSRPYRMQQVRVELQVIGGGNLAWDTPRARSPQALLSPLASTSQTVTVDGRSQQVQVFAWSALPLQSGPIAVDFGLLRAHAFGELRVYAPPALDFDAQALPQWWLADGLVGKPQVQTLQAKHRLQLGETGVWRLRLQGAGLDRAQVVRLFDAWRERPLMGMDVAGVDVRRGSDANDGQSVGSDDWEVSVFFRPRQAGRLSPPALRLDYFDPRTALPAVAWWTPPVVAVVDPRPVHLALGLGGGLALLGLSFALRAVWCCLRRRRASRLALARLAAADSADALRRAWLTLPSSEVKPSAPTLDTWLHAAAAQDDPVLRDIAQALQQQLYAAPGELHAGTSAQAQATALAQRLRQRFTVCAKWR